MSHTPVQHHRRSGRALIGLACGVALFALPAAAEANTRATVASNVLQVTTPSGASQLNLSVSGSSYVVDDTGGVVAAAGCTQVTTQRATCPGSAIGTVTVTGGANNDGLFVNVPAPVTLNGGAGDDYLESDGAGADTFSGGTGRDIVTWGALTSGVNVSYDGVANDGPSSQRNDRMNSDVEEQWGTRETDTFTDGPGAQSFLGFDGADVYRFVSGSGQDVVSDSSGSDMMNLSGATVRASSLSGNVPATIDLAIGSQTIHASGVDNLIGTPFNDVLSAANTGGMTLNGGAGDDTLTGGTNDDILVGGAGIDSLDGGAGDDILSSKDSVKDTVKCGTGSDVAFVDTIDLTNADCEQTS